MVIAGMQKLSLLDFPGHLCAIVFTQGCWFRCGYCHNPELIPAARVAEAKTEETLAYLAKHRGMLDGVCVTGGEPTIHPGLGEFLKRVKEMGLAVKLDTNGVRPEIVSEYFSQGLVDYVAMDLKHRWEKYSEVIKVTNPRMVEACRETFQLIQNSGIAHEFRTTIFPGVHHAADFVEMVGYLKPGEKYFLQPTRFQKTLDPDLPTEIGFDVHELLPGLQEKFPSVSIQVRGS
jgi:pyruvate formate lyase activating enzyme